MIAGERGLVLRSSRGDRGHSAPAADALAAQSAAGPRVRRRLRLHPARRRSGRRANAAYAERPRSCLGHCLTRIALPRVAPCERTPPGSRRLEAPVPPDRRCVSSRRRRELADSQAMHKPGGGASARRRRGSELAIAPRVSELAFFTLPPHAQRDPRAQVAPRAPAAGDRRRAGFRHERRSPGLRDRRTARRRGSLSGRSHYAPLPS